MNRKKGENGEKDKNKKQNKIDQFGSIIIKLIFSVFIGFQF